MSIADNLDQLDPDLTDLPDDGSGGDSIVRIPRKDIRALEKKGKQFDDVNAELEQTRRQLVFAQAGVDLDPANDDAQTFIRGYAGELDVAAIREKAGRFGVLAQSSATPAGQPNTDAPTAADIPVFDPAEADLAAHRQTLHQGASGDTGVDVDPYLEAIGVGQKVLEGGGKFDQAFGTAINLLANRAHNGDRRVIIDPKSLRALGGQ